MKNGLYFSILFLLMSSCAVNKKPLFIKVDDVKIVSASSDTIRLKAAAFFENPNGVGGTISTDEIQIIINGASIATVSVGEFKVPSRAVFSVPLTAVIPTKKVFQNNKNGILGGLINSLLKKSIKLRFKGNLKYKVFGFSNTYPIDKVQEIKL
ncbi:LEA type 2 family protein [Polaribacter sp.]|nr:LEA type 2 family protein [Polaribacter sp.]